MRTALLCVLVAFSAGCMKSNGVSVAPASKPATMTRDEFKAKVIGKTEAEVIEAVGKPDESKESGGKPYWFYYKRTTDPLTGKTDGITGIYFERGVVERVGF